MTKFRPVLPNRKSQHRTPASLRLDLHYSHLGVVARWDWDRYLRLAKFLNYTPHELGSLVCLPHAHVDIAERKNSFPGPAALLLTLLEAKALAGLGSDVIANPFPA